MRMLDAPLPNHSGRSGNGENTAGAAHRGRVCRGRRESDDATRAGQADRCRWSCGRRGEHDGPLREGGICRRTAADRRRRRGARRPDVRLPVATGRVLRHGLRGESRTNRRPLLDDPQLCRRPDRRARRRAHRPGPHRHAPVVSGARVHARQPPAGPAEWHRGLLLRERRQISLLTARRRPERDLPEDAQGRFRCELPDALEPVHAARVGARPHVDHRLAERDGPGGASSNLGRVLDIAYNIEYGAECSEQSALNLLYLLGYSGQGQFRIFGPSNEKYHVNGGNDQVPQELGQRLAGQIKLDHVLTAIKQNSGGSFTLTFQNGTGTKTTTVDHAVLAIPFSMLRGVSYSKAGFEPLKVTAITELPMGTIRSSTSSSRTASGTTPATTATPTRTPATRTPGRSRGPRAAARERASSSTTPEARLERASARARRRRAPNSSSASSHRSSPESSSRSTGTAEPPR